LKDARRVPDAEEDRERVRVSRQPERKFVDATRELSVLDLIRHLPLSPSDRPYCC
jgi:hypothetical protein